MNVIDRENFECNYVLYESLKKNRISYLETLGYALWFPFRFNDSCHHIMLDFTGTRKQTSLKINKQLNERFLIHGVMLSLWKTSKIQNIMFPLIFAMLLLDSKLLYSLSCGEYVNLFFWIFHISNSIWLIFFFVVETEHAVTFTNGTLSRENAYVSK